jgi:polysaccharide deacetylase 2 family uncharacterized protein YibQ
LADDLNTPLGDGPPTPRKAPWRPGRGVLRPLAFAIALALGALALWVAVVKHPLGGEPIAVAAISREMPPPSPSKAEPTTDRAAAAAAAAAAAIGKSAGGDGPLIIKVPRGDGAAAMAETPLPALLETSKYGPLPRIADDGRRPGDVYARPAPAGAAGKPAVALMVTGLGIGAEATEAAIDKLPAEVTLAFEPYGEDLPRWVAAARAKGHEVIVEVPMEPLDYPQSDPGPETLLTTLPAAANLDRLHWAMGRAEAYVGLAPFMGQKFVASEAALAPVLTEVARRGLIFVDEGAAPGSLVTTLAPKLGLLAARADVAVDAVPTPKEIAAALSDLEGRARRDGRAIGVARALPASVAGIVSWAAGLKGHGVVLVPVSAAMRRIQPSRS